MEPLAKLVVAMLELIETELAMAKRGVIKLALSIGMLIGAAVFGIIGLCWVLNGVFLLVEQWTNRPVAFLIAGVLFVAAAGILGVLAFGGDKKKSAVAAQGQQGQTPVDPAQKGKTDDQASLRIAG